MLPHIQLHNLLFIDIETVTTHKHFSELSETMRELWAHKHTFINPGDETPEEGYSGRAGVYAEFAKIICITLGVLRKEKATGQETLRLKTFAENDERVLLQNFLSLITGKFNDPERYHFCGHNIREFDIPFICRRLMINGFELPDLLDNSGKRPWQMNDVDTLQLWKFGDFKNYTSLKLLAEVLQIPTPKQDIEGKDVGRVYWQENDLERIAEYCRRDVVTVVRLMQRFKGVAHVLKDEQVTMVV